MIVDIAALVGRAPSRLQPRLVTEKFVENDNGVPGPHLKPLTRGAEDSDFFDSAVLKELHCCTPLVHIIICRSA